MELRLIFCSRLSEDANLAFIPRSAMAALNSFYAAWSPRLLSVLRIVAAFLFLEHGLQKLFGFPVPRETATALLSLTGVAGILEFFGGLLLLLGLFTRPVAFLLSGEMAVAYFMA